MSRAGLRGVHEYPLFVLLPYEAFHGTVHFVDVDGYLRLCAARVVHFVRLGVADALHVLLASTLSQTCSDVSLTSTCALSHLSMLSDLTFEMCVPSLRCRAAQRMHRKMPNCVRQYQHRHTGRFDEPRDRVRVAAGKMWKTYTPAGPSYTQPCQPKSRSTRAPLTWILRTAVGASPVPRHRLDQLLQRPLVTRLLAFVQRGSHVVAPWASHKDSTGFSHEW